MTKMDNLFERFIRRKPKYDLDFSDLFHDLAYYKGSSKKKIDYRGKSFANFYELYIYVFFLGLYNNKSVPLTKDESKKKDFIEISSFGDTNKAGRERFTVLQKYLFMACVAKTDIDLIALDKGKIAVNNIIRSLIDTLESFANGGLILLEQHIDSNQSQMYEPAFFLKFIKNSVSHEVQAEEVS